MVADREVTTSFAGVGDENLMQLKKLNSVLFPVRYNDKYYADAIAAGDFTELGYYNDMCVGAITCRIEKKDGGVGLCPHNDIGCFGALPRAWSWYQATEPCS